MTKAMTWDGALNVVVAAAMAITVGLVAGPGWAAFAMGAILALSLAVGVWAGSGSYGGGLRLRPMAYAIGAVVAVALGAVVGGTDTSPWWASGTILGIVLAPHADEGLRRTQRSHEPVQHE